MLLFSVVGSATASYTAVGECKIALICTGGAAGGMIYVNGAVVWMYNASSTTGMVYLWLSAGQTITITGISGNTTCTVSVLKE